MAAAGFSFDDKKYQMRKRECVFIVDVDDLTGRVFLNTKEKLANTWSQSSSKRKVEENTKENNVLEQ